jgi:hypothetical protein
MVVTATMTRPAAKLFAPLSQLSLHKVRADWSACLHWHVALHFCRCAFPRFEMSYRQALGRFAGGLTDIFRWLPFS